MVGELSRMKEENDAMLRELEKMKEAMSTAITRCQEVQSLIQQHRDNNTELPEPEVLLREVDGLISVQVCCVCCVLCY